MSSFYVPPEAAAIPGSLESDFSTPSDSGEHGDILRRRKTAFVQLEQLEWPARQYRTGELSMQEICALVTDATGHALNPLEESVREYWERHGIAWQRPSGRIWTTVAPEFETIILEPAGHILKRGVKKMHDTLHLPQYDHLPRFPIGMLVTFLIREIYMRGIGKRRERQNIDVATKQIT
jgi:hypothetical protein